MLENLQQIVIFATVAQEQNFTRAGERLGISKSQVSKQIRFLEERLGCQLVQRNPRAVVLTEIGVQYAEYGQKVLSTLDEAEAMVADHCSAVQGVLRVAVAQSLGNMQIINAFDTFQKKHPNLEIEVSLFDNRPNLLEEGFDCWIAIHEFSNLPEDMVAKKLADCKFVVVAAPKYLNKHGYPKTPDDLHNHNCITYQSKERKYLEWGFTRDGIHQSVLAQGNFRIDNAPALYDAVRAGIGVAYLVTYLLFDEIKAGKLIKLLPEWETDLELPIYAVYPRRKYLAPKVRDFIDFMVEHMSAI